MTRNKFLSLSAPRFPHLESDSDDDPDLVDCLRSHSTASAWDDLGKGQALSKHQLLGCRLGDEASGLRFLEGGLLTLSSPARYHPLLSAVTLLKMLLLLQISASSISSLPP